jgi:hypothetical protein
MLICGSHRKRSSSAPASPAAMERWIWLVDDDGNGAKNDDDNADARAYFRCCLSTISS